MERAIMAISSTDIAKAAEALNRHPELTPAARRVGLELLSHVDRATGTAWPSEARMAAALGYDVRTVRRGKAELLKLKLLSWKRRGTSWAGRTPLYAFAWERLLDLATTIKVKMKAAYDAARVRTSRTSKPSPAEKQSTEIKTLSPENRPQMTRPLPAVGRTFLPTYLSQVLNKASGSGFWPAPGTPQGQVLTDQQLNAKAHSRLWEGLKGLSQHHYTQLMDLLTPEHEAEAVKAERFGPGTGIDMLKTILERRAMA